MTTSTHKGAVNFHSYIESGVDPRTGTFSANILLGTLLEPDFDVRLCYSPLNQKDFGFGHGWRIPVTIYNTESKLLSLSDGRMYEVEENGNTLTLEDNTGDIHAVKVTHPDGVKITYRETGIVEWLYRKSDWYACTARTSPGGEAMYFKWHVEEDGGPPKIMLKEIFKSSTIFDTVDDKEIEKNVLLRIDVEPTYDMFSATGASEKSIVFWPSKDEERHFSLTFTESQLTQVNNLSFTPALQWKFDYDASLSPRRLHKITSPLGKAETVVYSKTLDLNGHNRVAKQNTYGAGTPIEHDAAESPSWTDYHDYVADTPIEHDAAESPSWTDCYDYDLDQPYYLVCIKKRGPLNFDNFNVNNRLECTAIAYEKEHFHETIKIEFTETVLAPIRKTELFCGRLENHLPGVLKRTDTIYCQLLPEYEFTRIMNDTSHPSPIQTKAYTWDSYGRLTSKSDDSELAYSTYSNLSYEEYNHLNENGTYSEVTTDEYTYLNENGTESGLLALHVHIGMSSTITDSYTYNMLPAVACGLRSIPKQQSNFLQSMSRATTGAPFTETSTCEYFDKPGTFSHGKLQKKQTYLLKNGATVKDTTPIQTTTHRYFLEGGEQTIQSTITGFDKTVATIETAKSIYTGLILREKDIDGNVSDYSWDSLSRLTKIINNSTTPYRSEETFTHGIIDTQNTYAKVFGSEQPSACFRGYIIQRDSTGRKILTGHDPYNHEVQTWVFHEAESGIEEIPKWVLTEEKIYDSARRVIKHTLIETDELVTRRAEYKTVYLTPYSYWTYLERAPEKYDIVHTLISECYNTRITTYIDSNDLVIPESETTITKKLEHSDLAATVDSKKFYGIDDWDLSATYEIPSLNFKPGKNKCWSRVERVDSRGNVIEKRIYTIDVEAKDGQSFSLILVPALYSSKKYEYNQQNSVISFTDEYDNLTNFKRDCHNRPSLITRPDGSELQYAYSGHSDKSLITQLRVASAGTTVSLGTQVFDGLDRLKESESGGRKQTFEYSGGQAPTKIIKPDGKHLQYDVISEFGGVVKSIKADGIEHSFEYFSDSGLLRGCSDQSGYKSVLAYDSHRNVIKEDIIQLTDRPNRTLSKTFSPTGKCTAFTDAATKQQIVTYINGKIATAEDADSKISNEYGAFEKIIKQTATNKLTKKTLITDYAYDILGNETSRTITTSGKKDKLVISQTLRKNNQLAARTVIDGKKTLRDETFSYSNVDMLTDYTCVGDDLPLDGYGKPISRLEFTYDTVANVTQCVTHFGNTKDTATFFYENAKDPCQLTRISHTHDDFPKLIELSYDANGCMTKNEKGQTLTYDALNRLASLKDGQDTYHYHYDPKGKLTSRTKLKIRSEWYYQPGGDYPLLSNQVTGDVHTRVTRMAEQVTAIVTGPGGSAGGTVQLIGIDRMNSPVIVLEGDGSSNIQKYSPSGHPNSALVVGQSGELYDDVGGFYHLGERQYSTRLFRFTTPDSWSPFGEAGPNCYAFLDSVNCRDPEGHLSGWAWFGIAMGVLAIVLGVVTLGASIAAMAAFGATYAAAFAAIGAISTIASGAVGIAAAAVSESDSALSNTLEWVSFGLAVVGLAFGMGAGFAPGASRMAMRGVRAAAPKLGRAARYAVQARVVEGLEMKPISSVISRSGVEMEMKFIGGSKYAFSTASSITSGLQSAMSGVFIETLARIAAQPAVRMVGTTMGMMSLLGLGIAAKQHGQRQMAR
jgi:RHS repeat-associated protein